MSNNRGQASSLAESLLTGERAGVGGFLCNDPNGLCLVAKGKMMTNDPTNSNSGVYTSLVRLASQLQEHQLQRPSVIKESTTHNSSSTLITIETDTTAILVKEYDGYAVAMRVPRTETRGRSESE
jgi:hypothetical protein